jgi:hypothetical protein
MPFNSKSHIWKLTDSGWAAIQRRHEITILGMLIALIGVIVAVISILKVKAQLESGLEDLSFAVLTPVL